MASKVAHGEAFILARKVHVSSRRHCHKKPRNLLLLYTEEKIYIYIIINNNHNT